MAVGSAAQMSIALCVFWLQWMASSAEQGNIVGVGVRDSCHGRGVLDLGVRGRHQGLIAKTPGIC